MNTQAVYEDRLVAFVDVLGWKAAVESRPESELAALVEHLGHFAEGTNERIRSQARSTPGLTPNPMFQRLQFGAFSDHFVISTPGDFGARIADHVATFCRHFLTLGFATRGGIAFGKLYHRDNVVFGPALNRAVELEGEAVCPRVLCDRQALEIIRTMPGPSDAVYCDHLGRWVVNLFPRMFDGPDPSETRRHHFEVWSLEQIAISARQQLAAAETKGDDHNAEKWRYLRTAAQGMLSLWPAAGDDAAETFGFLADGR